MSPRGKGRLVLLATARDQVELAIWLDLLREAGVEVAVHRRDPLGGLDVAPTPLFSWDLYVQDDDQERAREVLGMEAP
ncbi:MAG TPA: DUF2007 domain-containing protein [Dehalococcoidia bacterium]|nr:DUF2007 domain-containing protein [Dehalococcoidia bacterium]